MEVTMEQLFTQLIAEPLRNFYLKLVDFFPNLITALLIFIVGLIIGWIIKHLLKGFFKIVKLEKFFESSGISKIILRSGMRDNLSSLLARFIQWLIIFIFVIFALIVLNVPTVDRVLEHFLLYLPNVFLAFIIVIFGYMLSNFFGRAALIASVNAGFKLSGLVGKAVKLTILLFTLSIALEQLGIGRETVLLSFAIIFGGIVISFAIAFGLGGRDMAKDYLEQKLKGEKDDDTLRHI